MGSDAPNGVAGDVSRDGGTPSSRGVTTADQLRTLADWLDAHPGAEPSQIWMVDKIFGGGTIKVQHFGSSTTEKAEEHARLVGGDWTIEDRELLVTWRQRIMPGFDYEIVVSRTLGGVPEPGDETEVPF